MDVTPLASDPVLRMDLAFEWSIKKDLDPKGPPFDNLTEAAPSNSATSFLCEKLECVAARRGTPGACSRGRRPKSAEQEAAKGGRTLTTTEQARASPDLKATLDRKEREKRAIEMIRSRGDRRAGRDDRGGGGKGRGGR